MCTAVNLVAVARIKEKLANGFCFLQSTTTVKTLMVVLMIDFTVSGGMPILKCTVYLP